MQVQLHTVLFICLSSAFTASDADAAAEDTCISPATNDTKPRVGHDVPPLPNRTPIYVGGMFPIENNQLFGLVNDSVLAAVQHINDLDGILDGYELKMTWNWTEGLPNRALRLLYDFVYVDPPVLMVWGPMFSRVAVIVNEVAAEYNIIQVTLANSPTLPNQTRFPLTVRCGLLEDELNQPRLALMKKMGWTRAAIVFEDIEYFRSNSKDLAQTLEDGGVTVLTVEAINDKNKHRAQIINLMNHDARIIFASFYEAPASRFFCEVYRLKAYGPHIIWILNGWINDGWWRYTSTNNSTCSSEELEEVLRYHLAVHGFYEGADVDMINFGGIKPTQEQKAYMKTLVTADLSVQDVLSQSYDGMIVMALALNASVPELALLNPPRRLEDFYYGDTEMRKVFMRAVTRVQFYGATSNFSLDGNAARTGESLRVVVKQFQNTEDDPMRCILLLEQPGCDTHFTRIANNSFVWSGEVPPVDGKTFQEQVVMTSLSLRIAVVVVGTVGVVIAVYFLYINVRYRNRRAIKISSPKINNLTATGGLLLYGFVFVNSIESPDFSDSTLIVLCHLSTFLFCAGFSLGFGALFMKTFRIHRIFTKAVTQLKKVELPDRRLIMGACIPVAVDIIIIVFRFAVDDVTVMTASKDPEEDTAQLEREIFIIPFRKFCWSENELYFLGVLYAAKAILLAFGIFLAWETRLITVAELNDSKYLGMSVYVVALTVTITVPVAILKQDDVNFHYAIVSYAVIFANTTVLCLVFLPKVILFLRTEDRDLSITLMKASKFSGSTLRSLRQSDSRTDRLATALQNKLQQLDALKQDLCSMMNEEEPRTVNTDETTG
ncbi:gamma-aminobutyric acid type B receptor subunit 2-like isoform X1 [Acanthaster planci]|uniref:Gamma-aminobutyric acid type B receptor subunit 2 n=1 Tax=Acanthaster planci TaxID=133434 RepID=A0A8B7ZSS5_ACAPL|nr:gamma-aminobutyric acid type B receptor subunit 2-like isoform X1 [Acanthaster planci]